MCVYMHTYIHTYIHTYTVCVHVTLAIVCMRAYNMDVKVYVYKQYMYIYIYTYTCICLGSSFSSRAQKHVHGPKPKEVRYQPCESLGRVLGKPTLRRASFVCVFWLPMVSAQGIGCVTVSITTGYDRRGRLSL